MIYDPTYADNRCRVAEEPLRELNSEPIHPDTALGPVYLITSDAETEVRFYTNTLGLQELYWREDSVVLGAGADRPLVVITHVEDSQPKPANTTGLYHFALRVPTRKDLGKLLYHLLKTAHPVQGVSDHGISEAVYLSDSDGNGIEIYRDRPRRMWPRAGGRIQMTTRPLDVEDLMMAIDGGDEEWEGIPEETEMGHIHLHVSRLPPSEDFYERALGFEMTTRYGSAASFFSAGGYHHHIGLNTWAGVGAPPPPPDSTGLRYFTITLPTQDEHKRIIHRLREEDAALERRGGKTVVRDPSENSIILRYRGHREV